MKIIRPRNGALMIFFCLLAVTICCFHSGYENVRLIKDKDSFHFYPDHNAPREPMPLNIRTSFVNINDKWGILFSVPYRETGFGAINRTIFTTVLYLTAVDHALNETISSPMLIYKSEGNIIRDFFESGNGFGIAYITEKNNLICNVFDNKKPINIKNKYEIADIGRIAAADMSMSDLAISHYNEDLFVLVFQKDLKIIRAGSDGSLENIIVSKSPEIQSTIDRGDLYTDQWGIHAVWAEASYNCRSAGCASIFYACRSHEESEFIKSRLQVTGDSPGALGVKFVKSGQELSLLMQFGNWIWEGKIKSGTKTIQNLNKIITIGKSRNPAAAMFSCTSGDCYVFFHKSDGAYIYSKKGGLKKSKDVQYRRAVTCGEKVCIQETSNKGISLLDL